MAELFTLHYIKDKDGDYITYKNGMYRHYLCGSGVERVLNIPKGRHHLTITVYDTPTGSNCTRFKLRCSSMSIYDRNGRIYQTVLASGSQRDFEMLGPLTAYKSYYFTYRSKRDGVK